MYEIMDGLISICGGVLGYLIAKDKIKIPADEAKLEEWRNKFGATMSIVCPILVIYGIYRLGSTFF